MGAMGMSINTTFKALWAQLEILVPKRHHVAAKALLALAYDYRQDRDEPQRAARETLPQYRAEYEPTPEKIRQEIKVIQSEWTDEDFQQRARKAPDRQKVLFNDLVEVKVIK
jgi:hypothetical protein